MPEKPSSKKKGGGLGATLRGMIFEDDKSSEGSSNGERTETPVDSSDTRPVFDAVRRASTQFNPTFAASVSVGTVDPQLQAEVDRLLSERNPPVYLQFSSLLSSLASKLTDPTTRFTAALATAPLMGIDLAIIRSAYDERLKILDTLRGQFKEHSRKKIEECDARAGRDVSGIDSEITRISAEVEQARAHIANLEARSRELALQKEQKTATFKAEHDIIVSTETGMLSAFDAVKAKATTERDEVSRHISGV